MVAQGRHARHGAVRADEAVLADMRVVADLDEVVELGALTDNRVTRHALVNRAERADFHIVFQHRAAARVDAAQRIAGVVLEIVGVAADNAVGLDDDVVADHGMVVNADVGVYDTVFAYFDVVADKDVRLDDRAFADFSRGADGRGTGLERTEMPCQRVEASQRIFGHEQTLAFGAGRFLVNQDEVGRGVQHHVVVLLCIHIRYVTGFHHVDFVHTRQPEVIASDQARLHRHQRRQFGNRIRFAESHRS